MSSPTEHTPTTTLPHPHILKIIAHVTGLLILLALPFVGVSWGCRSPDSSGISWLICPGVTLVSLLFVVLITALYARGKLGLMLQGEAIISMNILGMMMIVAAKSDTGSLRYLAFVIYASIFEMVFFCVVKHAGHREVRQRLARFSPSTLYKAFMTDVISESQDSDSLPLQVAEGNDDSTSVFDYVNSVSESLLQTPARQGYTKLMTTERRSDSSLDTLV